MISPAKLLILIAAIALAMLGSIRGTALPEGVDANLAYWGVPKIETMHSLDTGVRGNVHSIATMPDGNLAVLAVSGLSIFDGTRWITQEGIEWPHQALALSDETVAIAYSGGIAELSPDPTGGYKQRMLTTPEAMIGVHPLMSVASVRGHIFGLRGSILLEIDVEGEIHRHDLPNWASSMFTIGDELYLTGGSDAGVNRWNWPERRLIDYSHVLHEVDYEWPLLVTPRAEGGVWILTDRNKIVGFDGEKSWAWAGSSAVTDASYQVKCIVETRPGQLALGTSSEGILFFDEHGKRERQISKEQGLDDVSITQLGVDGQDGLWVATKDSLSRVSLDFKTLVLDERHGLTETVNALAFFRDRLYLATDAGLFTTVTEPDEMGGLFTLIDPNRHIGDLHVHDDHLFIAGGQLKAMNSEGEIYTISGEGGTNLWQPSGFPDLMLFGNFKGVHSLKKMGERWQLHELLPGSSQEVFSMTESQEGIIWGGLGNDQIARITLRPDGQHRVDYMKIPASMNGAWSMATRIDGEVYINSLPCLRWDVQAQRWMEEPSMVYSVGGAPYGFEQVFGESGETAYVCVNSRRGETLPRPNAEVLGAISSVGNGIDTRGTCLAYDDHGTAWIGGPFGLMRAGSPLAPVPPLLDRSSIHKLMSLKDGSGLPIPEHYGSPLVLEPHQDSLRIEVAFQNFSGSRHNQFQIFIDGLDSEWADYSRVSFRELTNLDPGKYLIRVHGRNASGQSTPTLDIPILLRAHWYARPWAYVLYAATAALLIFGIVRYATKQQVRRAERLQLLVRERTREIDAKNLALEQQAETLEKQNAELAEKTDELQATTESLTRTLHQLQEAQEQLVATARTAGKAEIAINVLHNVGNVLNSLNVSLETVSKKVANSKVPRLARLAEALKDHLDTIEHFVTQDPHGKHMPEYVIKLAAALSEETASLAEEIEHMESEVEHIKRIVSAQQEHAKTEQNAESVNLASLCERAFQTLRRGGAEGACSLVNQVPKRFDITTDKHRVLEILINLLRNACDAVASHGEGQGLVLVSARQTDGGEAIILEVSDEGIGFSPELGVKLFRHGFTTKATGHGFGLHSAANAAKALGGELILNSPGEGKGATAILTVPTAAPSPLKPRSADPVSAPYQ